MALPGLHLFRRALLQSTKPGSCTKLSSRCFVNFCSLDRLGKSMHQLCRQISTSHPTLRRIRPRIYYLQNPLVWLSNRWEFFLLKSQWDPAFSLSDFQLGCKQTLKKLKTEVASAWKSEQRVVVGLEPDHVHVVLPHRVFLQKVVDDRYCDVDMILMGFKPSDPVDSIDINVGLLIEAAARFHRNYTVGILPDWTVTRIHLQSRDVQIKTKSIYR